MNLPQIITIYTTAHLSFTWCAVFLRPQFAATATVKDWILPVLLLAVYMVGGHYFYQRFKTEL